MLLIDFVFFSFFHTFFCYLILFSFIDIYRTKQHKRDVCQQTLWSIKIEYCTKRSNIGITPVNHYSINFFSPFSFICDHNMNARERKSFNEEKTSVEPLSCFIYLFLSFIFISSQGSSYKFNYIGPWLYSFILFFNICKYLVFHIENFIFS